MTMYNDFIHAMVLQKLEKNVLKGKHTFSRRHTVTLIMMSLKVKSIAVSWSLKYFFPYCHSYYLRSEVLPPCTILWSRQCCCWSWSHRSSKSLIDDVSWQATDEFSQRCINKEWMWVMGGLQYSGSQQSFIISNLWNINANVIQYSTVHKCLNRNSK